MCYIILYYFVSLFLVDVFYIFFFFKQKTAYEMRISDWSSDVCSSDLAARFLPGGKADHRGLGNVGEPVADDLAPAADHRRLDEAEFAKGGAADFGDEVGNRARFAAARTLIRSEERRVGKERVSTRRSRWSPYH